MMSYRVMAWVLIAVAVLSIALQVYQYRRGLYSARRALTGSIARFGFVVLGVTYAAGLVQRWRYAPLIGLGIAMLGFILYLANNRLENVQRDQ
jgi:phosphate/sulfate permease